MLYRCSGNRSTTKHKHLYDNEYQSMKSKNGRLEKQNLHKQHRRDGRRPTLFSSLSSAPAVVWTRRAWDVPPRDTHRCMLFIQGSAKEPLSSEPLLTSSFNYHNHHSLSLISSSLFLLAHIILTLYSILTGLFILLPITWSPNGKSASLLFPVLHPQSLKWHLAHSRDSANICGLTA